MSKPVFEAHWGPTKPVCPPQAMLEELTKRAVRAGQKSGREARERAAAKKK